MPARSSCWWRRAGRRHRRSSRASSAWASGPISGWRSLTPRLPSTAIPARGPRPPGADTGSRLKSCVSSDFGARRGEAAGASAAGESSAGGAGNTNSVRARARGSGERGQGRRSLISGNGPGTRCRGGWPVRHEAAEAPGRAACQQPPNGRPGAPVAERSALRRSGTSAPATTCVDAEGSTQCGGLYAETAGSTPRRRALRRAGGLCAEAAGLDVGPVASARCGSDGGRRLWGPQATAAWLPIWRPAASPAWPGSAWISGSFRT